jgi:hypothetical protein
MTIIIALALTFFAFYIFSVIVRVLAVKTGDGTRLFTISDNLALSFGTVAAHMTTRRIILFRPAVKAANGVSLRRSRLFLLVGVSKDAKGRRKFFAKSDLFGGRGFSLGRRAVVV